MLEKDVSDVNYVLWMYCPLFKESACQLSIFYVLYVSVKHHSETTQSISNGCKTL